MNSKINNITENIREILKKDDFTDLERKTVEELINEIGIYHEELHFQHRELERANSIIEASSNELFDLFDNSPVAYVVFDQDFNILKTNKQFNNYLHLDNNETNKLKITSFISDSSQDDLYFYIKNLESGNITEPIIISLRGNNSVRKAKMQISLRKTDDKLVYRATFTDITEQEFLQEQLRVSKLYYEKIIENSPYAIHSYLLNENDDLILNLYNAVADKILGISHQNFVGMKMCEIFPNLKNTNIENRYKEVAKNGCVFRVDNYRYEDTKISGIYSLVAYQPVQNQLTVFFRETTEEQLQRIIQEIEFAVSHSLIHSKSTEELIELVKDELGKIIDTTNFCAALYDEQSSEYTPLYSCHQYNNMNKWLSEKSLFELVRKTSSLTYFTKSDFELLIESKVIDFDDTIPESWIGIPLIENNVFIGLMIIENFSISSKFRNNIFTILQNVANYLSTFIQKKKSDNLANILNRSLVYSPVSIVITDPDGNIQYINPKCEEITGFKLNEVKNKKTSLFKSGHHSQEIYKNLWDTILKGEVWEGKFTNRKKDGTLHIEDAKIAPVFDLNNNISNFVAIKEDITLKQKLIEELKVQKEKAEESNRLKSAFLANMSHEIRTPLNAILGFSSILAEEEVTPEEKFLFCNIINEKGAQLLKLIEDILDLSKLEANQIQITPSVVSVQKLFDELNQSYLLVLKKYVSKHIKLVFEKPNPENLRLLIDSMRIRQIIDNLIDNAVKFTDNGEIKIKCELKNDTVQFSVSDTGIGINKENFDTIFERFRQADDDFVHRKYGGVGLGLPIVKRLVELLGGKIWLESEINKGSTFYFSIKYIKVDN